MRIMHDARLLTARKPSIRASVNIADMLQRRNCLISNLKALLSIMSGVKRDFGFSVGLCRTLVD